MRTVATTRADNIAMPIAIADVRTLRLGVGLGLAFGISQSLGWQSSFITPVLVSVLLALPLPAPGLKTCIGFALAITASLILGSGLLPMLHNQPGAGVIAVVLALFWCFYFGARGGSPALTTFLLLGLTVVPVIGSESIDAAWAIILGLAINAGAAFLFVWLAFALFPDPPAPQRAARAQPAPPPPSAATARHSALRSTFVVLPVLIWLLVSSETSAYAVVLLKIATMGQQSSLEKTSAAASDLLWSTLIGGIAGVIIWNVLKIWPNLLIFSLLFVLSGLVIGRRIFAGPGLAARGSVWSYGLLTTIIIVGPAAMDTASGAAAGGRFSDRIVMFVLATLYAVVAVFIFDKFWPQKTHQSA